MEQRISLGKSIQNRKKIYLDTNYWGYLCDVLLGKQIDSTFIEIYELLKQLVKEKKVICPLSYRIYSELLNQKDEESFNATVEVMNTLSEGVAIINEEESLDYELSYFFTKNFDDNVVIPETDIFVWTKIGCLIGHKYPKYNQLTTKEEEHLQKVFFKELWDLNILDISETDKTSEIRDRQEQTINTINSTKVKHEHLLITPHHVYMDEINGVMNNYENKIKNEYNEFCKISNINMYEDEDEILHVIYEKFYKKTMNKYIPSFDIGAKLHSSIRRNKKQKYKTNDIDDIGHTCVALPYFDYFFTERGFCNRIQETKYDEKYSCIVEYSKEKVLNRIKYITNQGS